MSSHGFFEPSQSFFIRRSGNLPHWRQEGAIYFVTFRLADSIPQKKIRAWEAMLEYVRRSRAAGDPQWEQLQLRLTRQIERWLDRGWGSCVLRFPEANALVEASLRHFDRDRYELYESTVAANHVHAIVRVANGEDLSRITYSWKRYTARRLWELPQVRSAMNRSSGSLWQHESFDHIVRNQNQLERFVQYIRNHPSSTREGTEFDLSSGE